MSIQINIKYKGRDIYETNDAIGTESRCLDALIENIEAGKSDTLYIHPQVCLERLTRFINKYTSAIEVRDGVSGGCYGARDGTSEAGLTLYVDASLFPARYIDSDGDEIVNLKALIKENGTLIENLDGEIFEDSCADLGLEIRKGNTYNDMGHSDNEVVPLQGLEYAVIEGHDTDIVYLVVAFHGGGDIRGNYSSKTVYKFDSIDELYDVFSTECQLKEQAV